MPEKKKRQKPGAKAVKKVVEIDPQVKQRMIAEAAYYIAEHRGFGQGDPQADWLTAEAQINEKLTDTVLSS